MLFRSPVMALTALTQAGILALDRIALRPDPGESITDVNGLVDRPWNALLAISFSILLTPLIAIALVAACHVVEERAHDHRPSGWRAIALAFRHPSAVVVQLVLLFVVTLMAASLYLLPVALLLIALWAVAMPSAEIERRGVRSAFRRSRQLTHGRRWRTVLLSALLVWIGFAAPDLLGGTLLLVTGWPFWATNVVAIAIAAVLVPFSAIGLTLQFYDFRQEADRAVTSEQA